MTSFCDFNIRYGFKLLNSHIRWCYARYRGFLFILGKGELPLSLLIFKSLLLCCLLCKIIHVYIRCIDAVFAGTPVIYIIVLFQKTVLFSSICLLRLGSDQITLWFFILNFSSRIGIVCSSSLYRSRLITLLISGIRSWRVCRFHSISYLSILVHPIRIALIWFISARVDILFIIHGFLLFIVRYFTFYSGILFYVLFVHSKLRPT